MLKRIIAVSTALVIITAWAEAQEVKVGVKLPYTGIGAEFAQLVDRGMELYLKLNADKVKPYKITLIKRDVKDPGGANAKIAVQELLDPGQRRHPRRLDLFAERDRHGAAS